MAVLASVGPLMQQFAESALTDGGSEVAEYGEIYRFLSLRERLLDGGGYLFALAGMLSGLAASVHRTPIRMAVAATIWLWALLCAIDIATTVFGKVDLASPLALQVLFDAAGAIAAGAVLATLLSLAAAAGHAIHDAPRCAALQFSVVAIGGLLISGTAYALMTFAYRPSPSWIEVTAELPLSGWALGAPARDALDANRTLDWLPRNGSIGRLSAQTVQHPLIARWRPGEDGSWRMAFSTYERCLKPNPERLVRNAPEVPMDARSALIVRLDGDMTLIESDKHANVDVDLGGDYTQFSLEPGAKGRGPKVTNLTGVGASARVEPFGTTRVALSTSFLDGRTARGMGAREFSVRGVGGSLRLRLRPTRFDLDQDACRPVRWKAQGIDPDGTKRYVADVDGSTATILLRIERVEEGPRRLDSRKALLGFERLDAWVRTFDLDSTMVRMADFGTAADVSFWGKVSNVSLDRQKMEIGPDDHFHIVGAVTGKWLDNGGVRLSGRADQFWRNGRVLNTTRWQRLSSEFQVFLLGLLGAALLMAVRAAWPFVRRHGGERFG